MRSRPTLRQRRTALLGLLGLTLAACEGEPPLAPEGISLHEEVASAAAKRPTTAEVNRQLAALRAATAHFQQFDRATTTEAGYGTEITPCWYHRDQGAQGYHYGNIDLIGDGVVDLLQPELLMYEPQKNGGMRLVGVEYIVLDPDQEMEAPVLLGQTFHYNEGLGLWALHVWLWRNNPRGMFADWNPMVSCAHAGEADDRA